MLLSSFKTNLLNLLILLPGKISPSDRDKRFSLFILIYFCATCQNQSPENIESMDCQGRMLDKDIYF